ncbi:MAG: cytochrome b/b6 domain-containing protein [Gemmobacter sp.]
MPLSNSPARFGSVARVLHWLTALMILTAIPLGLYANSLPYDTSDALAAKAQVFSLHKTLGVATFCVAMARILWALTQPRPVPLHPERRAETAVADIVHWMLYISLVAVPLSGWVHHAATTGFAPILWPFGQGLPFVPKSPAIEHTAAAMHWLFTKVLIAAILLHVCGAVKHHLIDRDATLRRMLSGAVAPDRPLAARHGVVPAMVALAIYAGGAGLAVALARSEPVAATTATPAATATGNWQVAEGSLTFAIRQMGAEVQGTFATWTADISFDPASGTGSVTVVIDMTSLTLGSVTAQAKAPDFLDTAAHPAATFAATIRPDGAAHVAEGTLSLRGQTQPLSLPFALAIDGDTATMQGRTPIDRRAFGIGAKYPDDKTVGFTAEVSVALTARRSE